MILEVCWDGPWTLSFGLSQFNGHGSWLMCEVALGVGHHCELQVPMIHFLFSKNNIVFLIKIKKTTPIVLFSEGGLIVRVGN